MLATDTRNVAAILLIAGLTIFVGLGRATLWEPDEPRFAEATRQMFERHDFLTPYLNGAPRFEKPVLFYWLQAAAFTAFGPSELGARVPAALAGAGSAVLLYLIGVRVASRRAALVAALALTTMFRFVTFARIGLTDIPVLFFILAAIYGFVCASVHASRGWLLVAWSCVGLGVLTKGPVGLLPVAVWATYAAFLRDWRLFTRIRPVMGLAVAIAIALPWYAMMLRLHGRGFLDFALGHEILERMVVETSFAPSRSVLYYVKVWPGDAAPWSALFAAGAAWALWRWRAFDRTARQPVVLALAWFACVFVVFSLPQSKVTHYVLPAYPAAALLIGVFVDRLADSGEDALWWRVPVTLISLLSCVAAVTTALLLDVLAPDAGAMVRWSVPGALTIGGAAVAFAAWKGALPSAVYALTGMLATVFALIGSVVIPRVVEPFKPMPLLAREAARVGPPDAELGLLGRYGFSSLVYYSHHDVRLLDTADDTVAFLARNGHALSVMPASEYQALAPRLPGIAIIAAGEEFNVRIERLLERQRTPGRQWVLVGRAAEASSGYQRSQFDALGSPH